MAKAKKRDNIIVAYFKPFGVKQVCDILMLTGAILALVGVFTIGELLLSGLIVFLVGDAVIVAKNALILLSNVSRKSPEYRNAVVNIFITGIMFLIALFGLIYYFVV